MTVLTTLSVFNRYPVLQPTGGYFEVSQHNSWYPERWQIRGAEVHWFVLAYLLYVDCK